MVVRWATRPDQETLVGTLATLPGMIRERFVRPPATIVVGEVVRLREKLNWYEHLPLFGRRIVVTRARGQADTLSGRLRALGADAIELPTIAIEPAADYTALDCAIANLDRYDWLIFTSANGVKYFLRSARPVGGGPAQAARADLRHRAGDARALSKRLHLKVDLMGKEYVAESLLEAFAGHDLAGKRILLPRAAVARDLLPAELARRGASSRRRGGLSHGDSRGSRSECSRRSSGAPRKPDWVTFTSSSTVQNLLQLVSPQDLEGVKVASIGPVTSAAARQLGIEVTVEAATYTIDGLIEAMLAAQAPPARL